MNTSATDRFDDPTAADRSDTVLVVDDQKIVCHSLAHMLKKLGFACLVAEDGVRAIDTFRKNKERIALIVLDLKMPGIDGADVLNAIRASGSDVPIILSSAVPGAEVAAVAEQGADGFLLKPYGLKDLAKEIEKVTAGR